MRKLAANQSEGETRLIEDVTEYGVHVVHVLADDEDGRPAFSYTVGLWHSFEQPEVIVFGLPEELAHNLLNAIADEASNGSKFLADSRHEDLVEGYPVRFLVVPEAKYADFVGMAQWAYEGLAFPVLQLVYPDKQGRWPWDSATREGFRFGQPVLGTRGGS